MDGERHRILIVGEAPGARNAGGLTRRRISELSGRPWEEWADWVNLLDAWPGAGRNGGSGWDHRAASAAVPSMPFPEYELCVLLGRRVAGAVLPGGAGLPWFRLVERDGSSFAVIPHTSGIVRFWNDPENVTRAAAFLERLASG